MSQRDTSQLTDIFLCALIVYLYGTEALVGVDVEQDDLRKNITFTVNVPSCDLESLQGQYHGRDDSISVIPKAFVDAYQFVLTTQRRALRDGTYRSTAWVEGRVG